MYFSMSSSHSQLPNTPALVPKTCVDIFAFFHLFKGLDGLPFVAIHLPAPGAFAVFPFISNKSNNISQRISQKQTNFMWKRIASLESFFLTPKGIRYLGIPIAVAKEKPSGVRIGQIRLQPRLSKDVDQRCPLPAAQYKQGDSFPSQPGVPLGQLFTQLLFTGIRITEQIRCL